MAEEVYKLGDVEASFSGNVLVIRDVQYGDDISILDPQPHELRKLAKAIEDHKRMRELGEDSNHIA